MTRRNTPETTVKDGHMDLDSVGRAWIEDTMKALAEILYEGSQSLGLGREHMLDAQTQG